MLMFRVAIDTGGTFTDFIAVDGDGRMQMLKTPTARANPAVAVMDGLKEIAALWDLDLQTFLGHTRQIVHGTTLALNALLQGRGVRTALLTTEGFRDALEIRRSRLAEQWDLRAPVAPPLVPRRLRLGIRERLDYRGSVLTLLDEAQVEAIARQLIDSGVESIAICFLFSYKNSVHEEKAASILRKFMPHTFITKSSDIAPRIGEYERTSTTVLNAYLTPGFADYLGRFEIELNRKGWQSPIYLSLNSGGLADSGTVKRNAVKVLLSGPAGGVKGGQILAATLQRPNLILADMGGTSFDVSLVVNGNSRLVPEAKIAGYPMALPMMDINSVGAGGGSIVSVDESNRLRIGPESAGSIPGPACYGNGGDAATVTDAVLVLGLLNPHQFMGGKIHLDTNAAKKVIQTHIAAPLGLTIEDAALVAYRVAAAKMADTARLVIAQQGLDPRRFSLVAAGGAFPLFAALIADELKLAEVLIPWHAPAFCAWGMLGAPRQVERVQTCLISQKDWNCRHISAMIEDALRQGYRKLEDMGILAGERESELAFEMKYTDQHHEISIGIEGSHQESLSLEHVNREFHRRHQELYGYAETDHAWEIVNLRVVCREKIKPLTLPPMPSHNGIQAHRQREVLLDSSGKCAVKVYDTENLPRTIQGPALVEMPYTTIYVPPGFLANSHSQGFITLQRTKNKENFDDIESYRSGYPAGRDRQSARQHCSRNGHGP